MGTLLSSLGGIAGLVGLICFIMVLIKMFQNGQMGLGIACIVLVFCIGIGYLIAFVYGWTKATEWNIKNVMLAWTVAFVVSLLFGGLGYAINPPI